MGNSGSGNDDEHPAKAEPVITVFESPFPHISAARPLIIANWSLPCTNMLTPSTWPTRPHTFPQAALSEKHHHDSEDDKIESDARQHKHRFK